MAALTTPCVNQLPFLLHIFWYFRVAVRPRAGWQFQVITGTKALRHSCPKYGEIRTFCHHRHHYFHGQTDDVRGSVRREVKQAQGREIVSPVQNAPLVAKWAQLIYANLSGQVPTRLGVAVRANIHLRSTSLELRNARNVRV